MAIDGTNILESDLSIDVQNEILDRYDIGQSADEIKSYLKMNYKIYHLHLILRFIFLLLVLRFGKLGYWTITL